MRAARLQASEVIRCPKRERHLTPGQNGIQAVVRDPLVKAIMGEEDN